MIIGKASSLANPLGMSAYATYGVKPAVGAYVVFSVGATGDNKSNAIDGSVPHISISDGIAIFDVPQTNQLLGIGDKVTHASGVCYLLSKITQSQWIVTTATGSLAPDLVSTLVTSITKTSNSLYSLFNGGALNALLGTYDLVTSDLQVHVTCYDHSDTAIAPVMIDSWVTDQSRRIKIYTPTDINHDCNRSQRHDGTFNNSAYSFDDRITLVSPYTEIEGLKIASNVNCIFINAAGCRVHSCVMDATVESAIRVDWSTAFNDRVFIHDNIIFNIAASKAGIDCLSDTGNISVYGNTVYTTVGIGYRVDATATDISFENCIAQVGAGTGFIQNSATVDYCLSDDASIVGGTGNVPSTTLFFRDVSQDDYRLDYRDGPALSVGHDLGYEFNTDIEGKPRGASWCIGASQYVVNLKFAIGKTTDIKSGGTVSITDGIMTFSTSQVSEYLTEGMKVTYNTIDIAYLYRKIDNQNWYVIEVDGSVPSDIGALSTLDSIAAYASDLYATLENDGSGNSQLETDLGSLNLTTLDVCIDLILGQAPLVVSNSVNCDAFVADITRRLSIYAARDGRGADSTYHKYLSGIWDSTRYFIQTSLQYALKASINYLEVDGLQTRSAGDGIQINGGLAIRLTRNIIHQCVNGIVINNHDDGNHEISNNVIYRCSGKGIDIKQNIGSKTYAEFGSAGNDLWSIESLYNGDEPNSYMIRVIIGPTKKVEWGPNSLTIVTDGDSLDNILASAEVTGMPWGVITPIDVLSFIDEFDAVPMSSSTAYVEGTYGSNDHIYYVYNNTVALCGYGFYFEALNTKRSNIIIAQSNIAQKCIQKAFAETQSKSQRSILYSNYDDDGSIIDFAGSRNETIALEFRKLETEDFHLKLYSAVRMRGNVYDAASDGLLSISTDINHISRIASWWPVAGAHHYVADNVIVYSVGSNTSNLDTEASRAVTIQDDLLVFGGSTQINEAIGVGDKVTTSFVTCVLIEKGSRSIWRVRNVDGTTGVTNGTGTVTSIMRCFNDLQDAFAQMSGTSYLNSGNLTSIELNLDVACYNDGGTDDGGTIATFTTNALYRLRVYTPININTECSQSQRHTGVWGVGFTISASAVDAFVANAHYYTIEGLQIEATNDGIYVRTNSRVLNNIVRGAANGIKVSDESLVAGNIIYGSTAFGITSDVLLTPGIAFLNNTVYATSGVHYQGGGAGTIASNNIAATTATGFASLEKCFNNIDRSGGLGSSRGNIPNLMLTFRDQPSDDYHLNTDDVWAIGGGLQDPFPSYYYRGINSNEIEQYPIGADAVNPETRSISFLVGYLADFKTGLPEIRITDGLAQFTEPQTSGYMMVGAMVSFDNMDEPVFITCKLSQTEWLVRTKYGNIPNDNGYEDVLSITSAGDLTTGIDAINVFNPGHAKSLDTFLGSDTHPFVDLTQIKLQINVVFPVLTPTIIMAVYDIHFITDANHYFRLYTPYDTITECNVRSRPEYLSGVNPIVGFGLQNKNNSHPYTISVYAPYTIIEGLTIYGANDSIHIHADNVQIIGNFFSDTYGDIAIKAKEGIFRDSFISGVFNSYWDTSFASNFTGINNPAAADGWYVSRGLYGTDDLTKRTALIGGRFDIEFGLFFAGSATMDTMLVSASDDIVTPNDLFSWNWGFDVFTWSLSADAVTMDSNMGPVTHRIRVVRGGTLTSNGIFVPDSNTDTVRCYYYDDWIGLETQATLKWIQLPTIVTGVSQPIFFVVNSNGNTGPSGLSYISFFAETNGPSSADAGTGSDLIANNIIQDFDTAIKTFGSSKVYNNTINKNFGGSPTLGIDNTPTDDVRNNIVIGYPTCLIDNSTCQNNTVSDATAGSLRGNQSNKTVQFESVNVGSYNYHLKKGIAHSDACRGTAQSIGVGLPIDAQAIVRGRLWDRGALEYIVTKRAFFSTGNTTDNLSSLQTGTIFEFANSIVTFPSPQLGDVGKGDKLTFESVDVFYISERIDEYNWRVCSALGAPIPDGYGGYGGVGHLTSITRAFTSLYNAFFGPGNIISIIGANFVSAGVQANVVQYYDRNTPDILSLDISGLTCDVDHFLKIFTPNAGNDSTNSHRHGDVFDVDKSRINVNANDASLYLNGVDFVELEGLQIDGSSAVENAHGIETVDCNSVFISKCILRNVRGTGILVGGSLGTHVVVNCLIYDGGEHGIKIDGSILASLFRACVYSNTIVNVSQAGIQILSTGIDTGCTAHVANNVVQDCGVCIDQSSDPLKIADLSNNLTDDNTASDSVLRQSFPNVEMLFVDKPNKVFFQSRVSDHMAINHGYDLSDDAEYSFDDDISGRSRPAGLWDVGAFESSILTALDDSIQITALKLDYNGTTYLPPGMSYVLILYLRHNPKPPESIPINGRQFVDDMNALNAVASANTSFDILIYVEAGQTFEGNFALGNRGTHAVLITTDPEDYLLTKTPGVIRYAANNGASVGPFIRDSIQGQLHADGIIIVPKFENNTLSTLVPYTSTVPSIVLRNSVIVVAGDSLTNYNMTSVKVVNCQLFYRKFAGPSLSKIFLSQSGTATIWNSMIVAYTPSALVFEPRDGVIHTAGEIRNCNLYNYQGAGQSYYAVDIQDSITENPFLKGVSLTSELWTVSDISNPPEIKDLEQASDSAMTNAGSNSHIDGLIIDIVDRARIFGVRVDIGPFEPLVYDMEFMSDSIRAVFQDKLRYDAFNTKFIPLDGDREYRDLVDQFITNPDPDAKTEFARESKIFIELSQLPSGAQFVSDKPKKLIATAQAYIDAQLKTIVLYKTKQFLGNMLINLFSSSQYVFHFDETRHLLEVYLSYTHDKGLSGSRNIVKNVRFGGNSVM